MSQVTVIGYPIGGDTMSVTSGVVSRIEVTSYVHGSSELLGVQIDAAINAGNSGAGRKRGCRCCCNHARQGCTKSHTLPACLVRLQRLMRMRCNMGTLCVTNSCHVQVQGGQPSPTGASAAALPSRVCVCALPPRQCMSV